jgi:hypothetical protein
VAPAAAHPSFRLHREVLPVNRDAAASWLLLSVFPVEITSTVIGLRIRISLRVRVSVQSDGRSSVQACSWRKSNSITWSKFHPLYEVNWGGVKIFSSLKYNLLQQFPYFPSQLVGLTMPHHLPPCSFDLSATSQQYFYVRTNQPAATSQQYFSLRIKQHQPSATSHPNRLFSFIK